MKSPGREINVTQNYVHLQNTLSLLTHHIENITKQVIMGGGRSALLPKELMDIEEPKRGKRRDGKNLIDTWIVDKSYKKGNYVTNRNQLLALNTSTTDYLLGLFA